MRVGTTKALRFIFWFIIRQIKFKLQLTPTQIGIFIAPRESFLVFLMIMVSLRMMKTK